jgi:pimeloyl-ACP methyl ester carboxylesterase
MNKKTAFLALVFCLAAGGALAEAVPAAIGTDPPADAAHPASMSVLHIPDHGVLINGLVYAPGGTGPHPTVVICHGLPGNEKNLDLAQALRRAGWNAVTFNYRGSWGSAGKFSFAHTLQDAEAVLAYLREPANAQKLGIDTHRIALVGHSMGGWITAYTAEHDHALIGAVLISMGDMSRVAQMPHDKAVAEMADNMETLAGVTAESMADELAQHEKELAILPAAGKLVPTPLLAITSDDGGQIQTDNLVDAIKAKGGKLTKSVHVATDHGYSDHRIALESIVIQWLQSLP